MTRTRTRLLNREEVADKTVSFHFEKPTGMAYEAGQYLHWFLTDATQPDEEGTKRAFTLASAPYELTIMATTRLRDSAYKHDLMNMPIGTEVELDEPQGDLTLHDDTARPAVFLVGGVGITPVRSMVLQSTHDTSGHKLIVFYSNHGPKDALFLDDFRQAEAENDKFTFVPTMTDVGDQEWTGETGHIDKDMVARHVPDLQAAIYYLSGPAAMIEAMQDVLHDAGVEDANIRTEEFPGY